MPCYDREEEEYTNTTSFFASFYLYTPHLLSPSPCFTILHSKIASMSGLQLTSLIKVMVAAEETNDEDMLASLEDATVVTNSKDGRASVVTDAAIKDTPEILNGISDEIPVFKDTRRDSYNPSIANKFYDKKAIEGEPEKMNDEKDKAMVLT